jgi:sodium-dependent dicarboxylate transporter 2/3/5
MSAAVMSIIILLICVVLFVTEVIPLVTTAIFGATAMAAFGVCSFSEAYGGFASDTVMLVVGMVTLGNALFETGAARLIGNGIVKLAGDSEKLLLAISVIAAAVLSMFLSNTATTAMFMAIISGVVIVKPHMNKKDFFIPIGMGAVAGGTCTLVGSTPQVVAQGILQESLGKGFEFFDFAWVGVPIVIVMVIYFITIGYSIGKKTWGDRVDDEEPGQPAPAAKEAAAVAETIDMKKVYISLIIFALTVTAFITKFFAQIGLTCMVAGVLCVLTGCISQKKVIDKMDWVAVGVLGGSLGMAKGLEVSGGGKMIADAFINLVGMDAAPFVIFAAIIFIVMALSQFMSNTACTAMLVPISLFICKDMGLNPYAFAMGIIIAANMSFSTPVATTPITLTLQGGYRFMDYVKVGGPFNIVAYFMVTFLTPVFFPLVL